MVTGKRLRSRVERACQDWTGGRQLATRLGISLAEARELAQHMTEAGVLESMGRSPITMAARPRWRRRTR